MPKGATKNSSPSCSPSFQTILFCYTRSYGVCQQARFHVCLVRSLIASWPSLCHRSNRIKGCSKICHMWVYGYLLTNPPTRNNVILFVTTSIENTKLPQGIAYHSSIEYQWYAVLVQRILESSQMHPNWYPANLAKVGFFGKILKRHATISICT